MIYLKKIIKFFFSKMGYGISPLVLTTEEDIIPEYADQKKIVGSDNITIFDVGAHHGQTSTLYNTLFKKASIYSFEPSPDSFEILKKNIENYSNIKPINNALGNICGKVVFNVNKSSQTNSLLKTDRDGEKTWGENLLNTIDIINIDCITIDEFVEKNEIDCIDILKLDTQGTEYQVIEGAANTIAKNKIKLIYLEIITMPTYSGQKHFDEILLLLRNKEFNLFNLYNYSHTGTGALRQVDAIFIHKSFQ